MRGACSAIGLGGGGGRARASSHNPGQLGKRMVGRGSSLNEISSMWSSFNPPIVMNDDERERTGLDYECVDRSGFECETDEQELEENYENYEFEEDEEDEFDRDEEEEDDEDGGEYDELASSSNATQDYDE